MEDLGTAIVDWETRVDVAKMRQDRLDKAREALASSEADVLLVFRPEDARYLTGYRHHLGPALVLGNAVVVLTEDQPPLLFTMDYEWCRASMRWLDTEQIQPRANFREEAGIEQWANELTEFVGDLRGKTIGVDIWDPTLEAHLRSVFSGSDFVDGYKVLVKAKITKTEEEIACLKTANAMTEAALDAALEALRPGIRECEVLAVAWQKMTSLGSEWTQCANIVTSGPYTAPYRRFTSDRIIRVGDLVIIDIGACFNGYWGDMTRTWVCGDVMPTDEQRQIHQNTYDALWGAISKAIPGNTNADVFQAADPYALDSLGHGSGTNPWEPPFFSPRSKDDPLVLTEAMQFNLEPYDGKPGVGGVRLENNVVVRADGPEVYTHYPFDERLLIRPHELDPTSGRGAHGSR